MAISIILVTVSPIQSLTLMIKFCLYLAIAVFFCLSTLPSHAQTPPAARPRPSIRLEQGDSASFARKIIEQSGVRVRPMQNTSSMGKPAVVKFPARTSIPAKESLKKPNSPRTLGAAACIDTSGHILTTEANTILGPGLITYTHDGNILVPGFRYSITRPYFTFPYLVKYTPQGSILWSKSFDGLGIYPQNYASAYKCFELNDGSLLLVGSLDIPEKVNGRTETAIWRLDAKGNLLWVQTDSCSIWTQYSGSLDLLDLVQDQAGNMYIGGNQRAFDALTTHTLLVKMDLAGNVLWDKSFTSRLSSFYGMMWTGNELAIVGNNLDANNANYLWCLKIDPATGDTLRSKTWVADYGTNTIWNSLGARGFARRLPNGNIAVVGPPLSDFGQTTAPFVHGVMAEFDPSFNFLHGWMLKSNIQSNYYNTVFTEHASGRISYTYMKYIRGFDMDIVYGAIEQGQIVKERVLDQRNRSSAWTSNFVNITANQDAVVQYYGDPVNNVSGHEFVRLHDTDTSSVCNGHDTSASWLEPYRMKPYYRGGYYCESIFSNSFRRTDRTLPPPVDGNLVQRTACKLTSFCTSARLTVDQNRVCAGSPAVFTFLRNPECGGWPLWQFDTTNIQSYEMPTDTTLKLIYRDQHQGDVSALMTGTCSNLSASKPLTVLPANKPVSLGGDAYLCPDSTLVLRPPKGYSSYLWQDGSAADTLVVTSPGTYTVTVTNPCGVPSSATAVVRQAPSLNFSLSPDISSCLNDPVTLHAPDGYNTYSWSNKDSGNRYSSQTITLYPGANAVYLASARTSLGCVVKSSIAITVKTPLPIELGNDTSFCKGDSLLLNAGGGFLNYLWNTGATGSSIFAHDPGAYSVKAQSPNGCFGRDTLVVVQVYPLPVVQLNKDNWLCESTVRTLDAGGGYLRYQWQDGSGLRTFRVDRTGTYWVRVTDKNGCSGGDTVAIKRILSNPKGFLAPDTVICNGYPSKIAAREQFPSYSWSTGETGNFITVKQAGEYSLRVTDGYGCSATENISITTKQCLFGIYSPTAFSPNGDGANDVFRPYAFGNIVHYQLQVFNRWGQLVFATEDYTRGWDGSLNSLAQPTGTYIWVSRYQFNGEKEKTERGTFLLIR